MTAEGFWEVYNEKFAPQIKRLFKKNCEKIAIVVVRVAAFSNRSPLMFTNTASPLVQQVFLIDSEVRQ